MHNYMRTQDHINDSNSATDHTPNRRNTWSVCTPRQSCVLLPSYRLVVCKVEFRNLFNRNHHEHECRRSKLLSSSPSLDSSSSPELPLPIDIVHGDSNTLDIQDENTFFLLSINNQMQILSRPSWKNS